MKSGRLGTTVTLITLFLLLVPALCVAQTTVGDERRVNKPAPVITGPEPTLPGLRPPRPVEPSPAEPLAVTVTNFPVNTDGRLMVCEGAAPRPVEVVNPVRRFELVGFSSAATLPNIGVFGMTNLCRAEYAGTRMCTLSEALGTVAVPALPLDPTSVAWVRLESESVQGNGACLGWGSTSGNGTVIGPSGIIAARSCDQTALVACCAPSQ